MSLRAAHKERTRAALVAAAARVVDSDGIAALTAEAVAEQAGVSRRTLFNYFGSVEECLLAPVGSALEAVVAEFDRAPAGTPPLDVLREALPRVFDEARFEHFARIRAVATSSPTPERAEATLVARCVADAVHLLSDRLRTPGGSVDRLYLGGLVRSGLGVIETAAGVWLEETSGRADADSRALFLEHARRALDHLRAGYGSAPASPEPSLDTTTLPTTPEGRA
ncbi:TetR/AcrR family transcriptional regulator [Kytococcus schroeteri]|uniref:TetR/AcrR family transcriptional regulator n=1 Tax=Kytococcus schroeteri TaxID=138300 RepID=UPI0035E5C416